MDSKEDLVNLENKTNKRITNELIERIRSENPNTNLGTNILINLNPGKPLNFYNEAQEKLNIDYGYKKLVWRKPIPGSHIYGFATKVYYRMRRAKEDQTIILNGRSNSGKTEALKNIESVLFKIGLGMKSKKNIELFQNVHFILDNFGNSSTSVNKNSTRFVALKKYLFNKKGKLLGLESNCYLLESSRITNPSNRNFNIFYLINNLTAEEKEDYGLKKTTMYQYLNNKTIAEIDNGQEYESLIDSLQSIGMNQKDINSVFKTLVTILNIGNLNAGSEKKTNIMNNMKNLDLVSEQLGIDEDSLERHLLYKTEMIGSERVVRQLDNAEMTSQKNIIAELLYSLLFEYVNQRINQKFETKEKKTNTIMMMDHFGYTSFDQNGFNEFLSNYYNEKIIDFIFTYVNESSFKDDIPEMSLDSVIIQNGALQLMNSDDGGLIQVIEKQGRKENKRVIRQMREEFGKNSNLLIKDELQFGISHFESFDVVYDISDFPSQNSTDISFLALMKGSDNPFIKKLADKGNTERVTGVEQKYPNINNLTKTDVHFDKLVDIILNTKIWNVFNLTTFKLTNSGNVPARVRYDDKLVLEQVEAYNLANLTEFVALEFDHQFSFSEFIIRYDLLLNKDFNLCNHEKIILLNNQYRFMKDRDYLINKTHIYYKEGTWRELENFIRKIQKENNQIDDSSTMSDYSDTCSNYFSDFQNDLSEIHEKDLSSQLSDQFHAPEGDLMEVPSIRMKKLEPELQGPLSAKRRMWLIIVMIMTWWLPSCILTSSITKSDSIKMAFKEKVAIFLMIVISWCVILFTNIGLGMLLCPPQKVWLPEEVATLQGKKDLGVYMYGKIYDIAKFAKAGHAKSSIPGGVTMDNMEGFGGKDITRSFPVNFELACEGLDVPRGFKLAANTTDDSWGDLFVHDKDASANYPKSTLTDDNWALAYGIPKMKKYKKGDLVFKHEDLDGLKKDGYKQWTAINGNIFDLSSYYLTLDSPLMKNVSRSFFPPVIDTLFNDPNINYEITEAFMKKAKLNSEEKKAILSCLNNAFFVGRIDTRKTLRCALTDKLLLVSSCFILFVTIIKFFAALQLGTKKIPTKSLKHVIIQVPCYTEDKNSIKKTLDSIAALEYEDSSKLMFIVCDGLVVGSGNEFSTPDIVLKLLDINPTSAYEVESKAFESIGDPHMRYNTGKVFSGLYEYQGKGTPFLLVIKTGHPNEEFKKGNRGKRDTQLILMNFLKKVHLDDPMYPLELEVYYQINSVIGVDPNKYDFVLMVDADTEVYKDSLTILISEMVRDTAIMGICGETKISNENDTLTTMIQVYEYYISHNLAKAFESLFGSVTCLPGCFCMYRVKTSKGVPLLADPKLIEQYAVNKVDTLHLKNLLSLGEDRYLTTLMMMNFGSMKLKFIHTAKCKTVVPSEFKVLLSQRRRWINSTIHNLLELLFLDNLCGFACFSMRFVILLDLIGTLVLPATVIYIIYIIIAASLQFQVISTESLIVMSSTYVLQALIFIIRRQWAHIGWMIFYFLAMVLFNFYIPIYSFWHFDDFSWGNTRQTSGENKKEKEKALVFMDEIFDIDSIQKQSWNQYFQTRSQSNLAAPYMPNINQSIMNQTGIQSTGVQPSVMYNPNMTFNNDSSNFMSNSLAPGNQMNSFAQINPNTTLGTENKFGSGMKSGTGSPMNSNKALPKLQSLNTSIDHSLDKNTIPRPISTMKSNPNMSINQSINKNTFMKPNSIFQSGPSSSTTSNQISDLKLKTDIYTILKNTDLNVLTKRMVYNQLGQLYNMDIMQYKEVIDRLITEYLYLYA